ncbi:hypothetical protein QTO34_010423, partial [Cnephaeus nilssonii]
MEVEAALLSWGCPEQQCCAFCLAPLLRPWMPSRTLTAASSPGFSSTKRDQPTIVLHHVGIICKHLLEDRDSLADVVQWLKRRLMHQ